MKMVRDEFSKLRRVDSKLDHVVLNIDDECVKKMSVYAAENADNFAANPWR